MINSRRQLLRATGLILSVAATRHLFAKDLRVVTGNFDYIYSDPTTREAFKTFLINVFHLYPEDELHGLILQAVKQGLTDAQIYAQVQKQLDNIKPLLGDLRYSLPTLAKQKQVLADQTAALLNPDKRYEGYLEVGSNGRFLHALEDRLDLHGECFTMSARAPTTSLIDIVDRGQLSNVGPFIALNDYRPTLAKQVPARSIDLVTVYIGFHHCPVELRNEFISSIRDVLRPGGTLIVRDHNAHDERMLRMVALAHDVFNMGTKETWAYNARERRNFYSLATLHSMLTANGFKGDARRLLQDGDPTLNTLMRYTRA